MVQLLSSDAWKGGGLIQLPDTVSTPKAEQIVLNYCWVKPVVMQFRDRVPSGFFLADMLLILDRLWMGKLLIPLEEGESKQSIAGEEGKKLKMLIGSLRALWRSSPLVGIQPIFSLFVSLSARGCWAIIYPTTRLAACFKHC